MIRNRTATFCRTTDDILLVRLGPPAVLCIRQLAQAFLTVSFLQGVAISLFTSSIVR